MIRSGPATFGLVAALAAGAPGQEGTPAAKPEDEQRIEPMAVPRALVKERVDRRIVVDGALQDWPPAPPLVLDDGRQLSGTAMGAWRGKQDLAARVFLLWDEEDLYLAIVVRDDWHVRLAAETPRLSEIPPADNVMVSFDPERDTRAIGADPGRVEDREFWLADVDGQDRLVVQWDRLRGTARYAEGASTAIVRDADRGITTYEARLPWKEILPVGRTAQRGDVFDLQVVVSDYDEPTDPVPQTRIGWTFGTGPRIDPGLFGSIMLAGDLDGVDELPEFPSPAPQAGDAVPGQAFWVRFFERLRQTEPVFVGADSPAPAMALGEERLARLEELEHHAASFPRVDFLEYHHRVARRMRREVAGMAAVGLPFFWGHVVESLARRAAEPVEQGVRVFRLPSGGWLLRSERVNLAIDPAGDGVAELLWGALEFALLTSPHDITRRSDQALLRMATSNRGVLLHQVFHVPGVAASATPLVKLGQTYDLAGLAVTPIGETAGDRVPPTAGYVIQWPEGPIIVHSAESTTADQVRAVVGDATVDLLILSAQHPAGRAVVQRLAPRRVVFDRVLDSARFPGADGRVSLEQVFELQAALRPVASAIVAPGESIDVIAPK